MEPKFSHEDIKHEFSRDELKELCLNKKCYIRMQMWNPAHDFLEKFKSEGRLSAWSKRKAFKMIKKGIKRTEETYGELYPQDKIKKARYEEWVQRTKANVEWLEKRKLCEEAKDNEKKNCPEKTDDANAPVCEVPIKDNQFIAVDTIPGENADGTTDLIAEDCSTDSDSNKLQIDEDAENDSTPDGN